MKNYLNKLKKSNFTDVFDELPLWSAPFGLKLLEHINYMPNISALDIGFGTGFPLTEVALRLGSSSVVYGIDPWKEGIERAKQKIDYYEINNIEIIEGVAENIPLDDNSIDLIISNNGMNNVSDFDKAVSECARVMKIGGQFVQTMNTDQSMFQFYDVFERVLKDLGLHDEVSKLKQHIIAKRPPITYIKETLYKYGFILHNVVQDQFNYKFTNGTAMLNHYFIRLAFMDSWINLLPKDRIEEIFHLVEENLNKQSEELGILELSIPYVLIDARKDL